MAIDFSKFNLEIVDITTNANPEIYINKNNVSFSKRVLEDLNYPAQVQYCIDTTNRVFAVRACKGNEVKAVPFSKPRGEQENTLSVTNKNLREIVTRLIPDFDNNLRYMICGEFDPENKIMYYDMTTATFAPARNYKAED